jgi:signal transduction histidine kinase
VALDRVLALVLTAIVQIQVWTGTDEDQTFADRPLSSVLMLAATVPLVARRSHPLAVAGAYAGAGALQALVTGTFTSSPGLFLAGLVVLYSLGAYAARREALAGVALVTAGIAVRESYGFPRSELDHWNAVFFYALLVLAFVAGMYVRGRRQAAALERQAERLRREREEHAGAVAEERARIARELHDVIAHNVSATVLQAEAAEEVMGRAPEQARQALVRIQGAGREALAEMRRLLGIMRDEGGRDGLSPQPRVADLARLVEDARGDGLAVTFTVVGEPRWLPAGVDLSAYRIAQEALTNVRKHAGRPAKAGVVLSYADTALELEIADDGRGPAARDRAGRGLVGMRERVDFLGGELSAGPGADGGFVVRARFPLPGPQR